MEHQTHIIVLTAALVLLNGCKTSGTSEQKSLAFAAPQVITLTAGGELPVIDSRPFQFWLHTSDDDTFNQPSNQPSNQPILATNRTRAELAYVAKNSGIEIPVSPQAIQCMGEIFKAIELGDIKTSPEWTVFKAKFPYRFLEPLPELRDFFSFNNEKKSLGTADQKRYQKWSQPMLWNGFRSSDTPEPGETGFKLRGYLKWTGVLLPDGKTCLITGSDQVRKLLQAAMNCEDGNPTFCQIPTEP